MVKNTFWTIVLSFVVVLSQAQSREDIKKQYVLSVKDIMQRTNDPEAKLLYDSVISKLLILPESGVGIHMGSYYFFPIKSNNDTMNPIARALISSSAKAKFLASYINVKKTIFIEHHVPCTALWKGIDILHESWHAFDFRHSDTLVAIGSSPEFELRAHTFTVRIVAELGGSAYTAVVADELKKMRNAVQKATMAHKQPVFEFNVYDTRLDTIFGKALSPEEQGLRMACVWHDALFRLVDEMNTPQDAVQHKLKLLQAEYQKIGLISKE